MLEYLITVLITLLLGILAGVLIDDLRIQLLLKFQADAQGRTVWACKDRRLWISNALLWMFTVTVCNNRQTAVIYSLMISALLLISCIDIKVYQIPGEAIVYLFVLGIYYQWTNGIRFIIIADAMAAGMILWVVYLVTKGRGIGAGDIKLMIVSGLLLGWKNNLVALLSGCIYASVVQLLRMKNKGYSEKFAMGPYLSAGVITAAWFGDVICKMTGVDFW